MATVRDGKQGVLVVVDVQVGVMAAAWDADRVVGNVAVAVERARSAGVPVFWIQHAGDDLTPGTPEWQFVPQLTVGAGETVIGKDHNSSFEETDLDAELAKLGATHIALAGASTNWCIRATAYGALERGYDLTLVGDAHTTDPLDLGDGVVVDPPTVINDLNTVMRWISYPGRTTAVGGAADVDFAALVGAE